MPRPASLLATRGTMAVGRLVLAASFGSAPAAAAEPDPVTFAVTTEQSPTCPELETFPARLQARSPELQLTTDELAEVRYALEIVTIGARYEGHLEIREADGRRTLRSVQGDRCASVVDALALIASVLAEERRSAPNAAPAPAKAPADAATSPPGQSSRTPAPVRWNVGFEVTLGMNTAAGPAARAAAGADLLLSWRGSSHWAPELGLGALDRANTRVTGAAGDADFDGRAWRGFVSPRCWPASGPVTFRPAAGVEVGRLTAEGTRTLEAAEVDAQWIALALLGRGEAHLIGPLAAMGEGALVFPLLRDRFYFDTPSGRETAFAVPRLGLAARLGLVIRGP